MVDDFADRRDRAAGRISRHARGLPLEGIAMTTRVVHVSDNIPDTVYIGRASGRKRLKGSPFGNPFKVAEVVRVEAMDRYAVYLTDRLVKEQLIVLRGKPLACWRRHDG